MKADIVPGSVPADDSEAPPTSDDPDTVQALSEGPSVSRGDQKEAAIPKEIAAISASSLLTGMIPAQDNADDSSPAG